LSSCPSTNPWTTGELEITQQLLQDFEDDDQQQEKQAFLQADLGRAVRLQEEQKVLGDEAQQ